MHADSNGRCAEAVAVVILVTDDRERGGTHPWTYIRLKTGFKSPVLEVVSG